MIKWIMHIPIAGEDGDMTIPYPWDQRRDLEDLIDNFVRHTEIGVWLEWV